MFTKEECIDYKPYKFKELKEGMWVWDDQFNEPCKNAC